MPQNGYSAVAENYIKNVFLLQEVEGSVSTSLLSERLNVAPASATDMLKRLAEDGIIVHRKYKGARLTEKGSRLALKILRRHRLWELFLHEVLHFEWHEIHEEAERLEHSTSEALERKLDEYLGYPAFDPHGHAIPDADGRCASTNYVRLSEVHHSGRVAVRRVNDDNAQVLQYASRLGIAIGTTVAILERIEFDRSLRVDIEGTEQVVSEKLAGCIYVEYC